MERMSFHFDESIKKYTGAELKPLKNYLEYGLLGDSVVAWIGPCDVGLDEMVDAKTRAKSAIAPHMLLARGTSTCLCRGVLLQG